MSLEKWLQPVSESASSGPNLEYDPSFIELENVARTQPDQEFGSDASGVRRIEGSGPDWAAMRRLCDELLTRTKDLRVAVYLLRALTRTEGFNGFEQGIRLVHGLLERYWESVHPELDAEDDNDPTMRVNALAPLIATDAVIADLREAWIARHRQAGTVTVRDIEALAGRLPPRGDPPMAESQINGILTAGLGEDPGLAERARAVVEVTRSIEALVADKVGAAQSIDLKPLVSTLFSVRQILDRLRPETAPEPAVTSESGGGTTNDQPAGGVSRPGEIRSRDDVLAMLEKISEYLARTEPSSPVQLVLKRAQRMMQMSFLEILNDLAPDGLSQAEKVVGAKLENE